MPAHPRPIPTKGTTGDWNGTLINAPGHGSMYSTEEVEAALTTLATNGDNVRLTESDTGIKAPTLRLWRRRYRDRYEEIRRDVAPNIEATIIQEARSTAILAAEVERAAIEQTLDRLDAGELKDPALAAKHMATVKGINVDKFLILEQRPTSITTHKTADDVLRELAAYIDGTTEEDQPDRALLP